MKRYVKDFQDRYSLLREHQILDYLNQRRAPVPVVLLCDIEACTLEMSHEGESLQSWVNEHREEREKFNRAMLSCSKSLLLLSELGIWQIDVALRNFVIKHDVNSNQPSIKSIDFSNAIADNFKLQKPIWILPHAGLHPQLNAAIKNDWSNFCKRHNIALPSQWNADFVIPLSIYQKDWTENLFAESIQCPFAILCHAIAINLLNQVNLTTVTIESWQYDLANLLNLDDDEVARERLDKVLDKITIDLQRTGATPRPSILEMAVKNKFESVNLVNPNRKLEEFSINSVVASELPVRINFNYRKIWSLNLYLLITMQIIFSFSTWYLIDFCYSYFEIKISWAEIILLFLFTTLLISIITFIIKNGVLKKYLRYFFATSLVFQIIFFIILIINVVSIQGLILIAAFLILNFISLLPTYSEKNQPDGQQH